jgi:hypothetical protein
MVSIRVSMVKKNRKNINYISYLLRAKMNIESINLEPLAMGLYSLGVYLCITILWPDSLRHFGWLLFLTGVGKHISVVVLGLQNYFCSFSLKRVSRKLSETEIGRNPGGKEFREEVEFLVVGAITEGFLFWIIGSGIYWISRWKRGYNLFLTGVLLYYLSIYGGFRNVLCNRSFLGG